MCYRVSIKKRIVFLLLAGWISFSSVFFAYQETTYCAEWVAGVVATIGGAPMLTALCIGGVVVAGGIAIYELSQTTPEDHQNFLNGIKEGFTEYCTDSARKDIAMEGVITDTTQAEQEAVRRASEDVKNFWDNAVETVTTTGKKLKASVVERWNLFCKVIGRVSDQGISNGTGVVLPSTIINVPVVNMQGEVLGTMNNTSLGSQTFTYDGRHYLDKGTLVENNLIRDYDANGNIFFMVHNLADGYCTYWLLNPSLKAVSRYGVLLLDWATYQNQILNNLTFPILEGNFSDNSWQSVVVENYEIFGVGGTSSVKDYEETINDVLENTKEGEAIKTGRRAIVNNGDVIEGVFEEDSIPVKKSGVREADDSISAPVGWDIPADDVWDGVVEGDIPWQAVPEGTGTVSIPKDDVVDTTDDDTRVVTDPDTIVIDNTTPADPDNPMPDKRPWQEIIQDMSGSFFPAQLDWTAIFPFCIPFDIIYLIGKFNGSNSVPPIITIPIVYPQVLQPALGESYEVVIDFNNFVVVRNVIRVFLLLLFIIGLMKVTRDLIRG